MATYRFCGLIQTVVWPLNYRAGVETDVLNLSVTLRQQWHLIHKQTIIEERNWKLLSIFLKQMAKFLYNPMISALIADELVPNFEIMASA